MKGSLIFTAWTEFFLGEKQLTLKIDNIRQFYLKTMFIVTHCFVYQAVSL